MYLWFTAPVEKTDLEHTIWQPFGGIVSFWEKSPKKMSEINTGGSLGERMVTGRNWYGDGMGRDGQQVYGSVVNAS